MRLLFNLGVARFELMRLNCRLLGTLLSRSPAQRSAVGSNLTVHRDLRERLLWGIKTNSRGQCRTAGVGFETGPWLSMIDEGGR